MIFTNEVCPPGSSNEDEELRSKSPEEDGCKRLHLRCKTVPATGLVDMLEDEEETKESTLPVTKSLAELAVGELSHSRRPSVVSFSPSLAPSRRGSDLRSAFRHVTAPHDQSALHSRRQSLVDAGILEEIQAHAQFRSRRPSEESIMSRLTAASHGGSARLHPAFHDPDEVKTGLEMHLLWKEMVEVSYAQQISRLVTRDTTSKASSAQRRKRFQSPTWSLSKQRYSTFSFNSTVDQIKNTLRSRLMLHPNSHFKLCWDITGMLLMGYDLIVMPLGTFNPPATVFTQTMVWIILMFWTFDLPICFFTGFQRNGVVEMNPRNVAKHYLRTWFLFDVAVLAIDWTLTVFDEIGSDGSLGYVKMGRSARIVRMLRLLRLLRLLKVQGKMSEVLESIQSEYVRIILGIVKLIVCIMLVNHLIACCWYAIGNLPNDDTWVLYMRLEEKSIGYRYTTSLHWSLTQFTPASMEVNGRNTIERVYTVLVLIFAMVTFSSFISSITQATSLLRQLDSEDTIRRNALFKYLKEHEVPMALASEVWSWVLSTKDTSRHRVHEEDVGVLSLLPKSLRARLRDQVYGPHVCLHPFFKRLGEENPRGHSKCLAYTMSEVAVGMGQELFMAQEASEHMYFLVCGEMHYWQDPVVQEDDKKSRDLPMAIKETRSLGSTRSDGVDMERVASATSRRDSRFSQEDLDYFNNGGENRKKAVVEVGEWVCEPCLWVKWKHVGQLNAHTHSELYSLSSSKFIDLVKQDMHSFREACQYAKSFLRHIAVDDVSLTDVWADDDLLQAITNEAFDDFLFQNCIARNGDGVDWEKIGSSECLARSTSSLMSLRRPSTSRIPGFFTSASQVVPSS